MVNLIRSQAHHCFFSVQGSSGLWSWAPSAQAIWRSASQPSTPTNKLIDSWPLGTHQGTELILVPSGARLTDQLIVGARETDTSVSLAPTINWLSAPDHTKASWSPQHGFGAGADNQPVAGPTSIALGLGSRTERISADCQNTVPGSSSTDAPNRGWATLLGASEPLHQAPKPELPGMGFKVPGQGADSLNGAL